jgi:Phage tail tube protein
MARAYGSSAHLLMKRETAYGQAATGNYIRMPFNRCNLGSEQGLIDDPVLGQGRDPLAPLQDVINDEGDIVVPVDPRYLGLWLTGLFGDPDTTDNLDGSWDHEFASGGEDLPSYTIEVGMPKVPAFFLHAGVKLNSIALEFTRSGPAAATINAIAQGETRFATTQGGTPTSLTFSRISQFQGSIKRAGNPVGNLTGGSVTYSNNLEKIETIRDDGLLYPVGERFLQEFTLRQVLLNTAKNGSGLSAAGTSSPAEGPNTAEPAARTTFPARKANQELKDGSAPTANTF